jgi:glutamate--cysteine ligase catalytic subunit
MTDFENAAFSVFVVLLSRAILSFNLNFYIPISKVAVGDIFHAILLIYVL